jgi:hypothetical protein
MNLVPDEGLAAVDLGEAFEGPELVLADARDKGALTPV